MSEDTSCDFKMSYLEAIQKIPGNTAGEKFCLIGRLASCQPNAIENLEQLSPELLPLLQVEIAVKHKRHEDITLALKSVDSTIVSRALKASWFFDGEHETVDVAYFCQHIFPFVSLRTRNRIMKTLARRMKNPVFARKMFTAVAYIYNIETALPLIVACDEKYISQTVKQMNCLLSVKILKKLFYKKPLLAQFLFEYYVGFYQTYVSEFKELFEKYKYLLPKAIKNNPLVLVQINNLNFDNQLQLYTLSNNCTKRFLQKALHNVIVNPTPYFDILPNKIVNAVLKKKFPDLVNNPSLHEFYRNEIFVTLLQSPEERNLELHLKTYKDICNGKLVTIENVTPLVLRLLPAEKRIELVKKKMIRNPFYDAWICYFSTKKATSVLKFKLNQALNRDKIRYILQIIYACEVNNDENELYDTLKYIVDKGYLVSNNVEIYREKIRTITLVSKPLYLSERNGVLIYEIIRMFYEKHGYVDEYVLFNMILHRLSYNKSIENLINMLLEANNNYASIYFVCCNTPQIGYCNPQYCRQFFVALVNVIQQEYAMSWEEKLQEEVVKEQTRKQRRRKSGKRRNHLKKEQGEFGEEKRLRYGALIQEERLKNEIKYVLCWLVVGMYDLNDKCKKFGLELFLIENYPWLMNAIYTIMRLKTNFQSRRLVRILLNKYEPGLYRSWFLPSTSKNIADVISGAALYLLKHESESVLDNWEEYLIDCKRHYRHKHVQRFVRATRWYNDIPVKFAERCISDLHGEDTKEMSSALIILSLLLDVNSLRKLINPLLDRLKTVIDKRKYMHVLHFIKKFSNLPEFLDKLY